MADQQTTPSAHDSNKLGINDLLRMDLFNALVERAFEFLRECVGSDLSRELQWRSRQGIAGFESPLEAGFYIWWVMCKRTYRIDRTLDLAPQAEVVIAGQTYRLDFQIVPTYEDQKIFDRESIPIPKVAVELDGHEFHERTKEQVTYRNQRDRALQSAGWLVLHYSGSEFVRDPERTINDCWSKADALFWDAKMKSEPRA